MLLSYIGDKEVVDMTTGTKHGKFWNIELVFDEKDGTIKAISIPRYKENGRRNRNLENIQLPWTSVIKIGADIIVIKT